MTENSPEMINEIENSQAKEPIESSGQSEKIKGLKKLFGGKSISSIKNSLDERLGRLKSSDFCQETS